MPADAFVRRYGSDGDMVVLASPDAVPPAGTIGIFSDGGHHFEAVALSTLGRRMFYELNGDVLTTNGTPYLTGGPQRERTRAPRAGQWRDRLTGAAGPSRACGKPASPFALHGVDLAEGS
jgi:hypothetical protein